jgi:DNA polymerase alpha subunit A
VSCCVTVGGIERNLFVLPRERLVEQDDDGNICETDVVPTPEDVHDDFAMIMKRMKIKSCRAKLVKRNYAFRGKDVPRGESQWLEVVYGFHG